MNNGKTINKSECPHVLEMKISSSDKVKCDTCDIKEHIRLCTSCGAVNCCESGKGHDKDHFKATGHPIIKPVHADYDFIWCYKCEAYLK
jgi:uncharacterized UBP type Zn finger protein